MTDDLQSLRDELAALRSHVQQMEHELTALRASAPPDDGTTDERSSRRQMLRIAAGTATGAVAASLLGRASPVAAFDGEPVLVGNTHQATATTRFILGVDPATPNTDFDSMIDLDASAPDIDGLRSLADRGIAVYGEAIGKSGRGVVGFANGGGDSGTGVYGHSDGAQGLGVEAFNTFGTAFAAASELGVAVQISGGLAAMLIMAGDATAPPTRAADYEAGTIDIDGNADLWLCVASGNPGTWRKLGGPATAGAFHPIDPARVYDSRLPAFGPSRLAPNTSRVISVADGRDGAGNINVANVVPAGATAVAFNITAASPTGPNYLAVTAGDAVGFTTSTINFPGGFDAANGSTVRLDASRQIKVFCGDQPGLTDVIVDIVGYYR